MHVDAGGGLACELAAGQGRALCFHREPPAPPAPNINQELADQAVAMLRPLTKEARHFVMNQITTVFCRYCGGIDEDCACAVYDGYIDDAEED